MPRECFISGARSVAMIQTGLTCRGACDGGDAELHSGTSPTGSAAAAQHSRTAEFLPPKFLRRTRPKSRAASNRESQAHDRDRNHSTTTKPTISPGGAQATDTPYGHALIPPKPQ
jgi:hypothetical protein